MPIWYSLLYQELVANVIKASADKRAAANISATNRAAEDWTQEYELTIA